MRTRSSMSLIREIIRIQQTFELDVRQSAASLLQTCRLLAKSRRRSSANDMFAQPQATAALPSGAAIAGAPGWFGPAMAVALAPLQATLNQIETRQHNSQAMHAGDPIHPITDSAGNVPPPFLADVRALNNLNQSDEKLQSGACCRLPYCCTAHRNCRGCWRNLTLPLPFQQYRRVKQIILQKATDQLRQVTVSACPVCHSETNAWLGMSAVRQQNAAKRDSGMTQDSGQRKD